MTVESQSGDVYYVAQHEGREITQFGKEFYTIQEGSKVLEKVLHYCPKESLFPSKEEMKCKCALPVKFFKEHERDKCHWEWSIFVPKEGIDQCMQSIKDIDQARVKGFASPSYFFHKHTPGMELCFSGFQCNQDEYHHHTYQQFVNLFEIFQRSEKVRKVFDKTPERIRESGGVFSVYFGYLGGISDEIFEPDDEKYVALWHETMREFLRAF